MYLFMEFLFIVQNDSDEYLVYQPNSPPRYIQECIYIYIQHNSVEQRLILTRMPRCITYLSATDGEMPFPTLQQFRKLSWLQTMHF